MVRHQTYCECVAMTELTVTRQKREPERKEMVARALWVTAFLKKDL